MIFAAVRDPHDAEFGRGQQQRADRGVDGAVRDIEDAVRWASATAGVQRRRSLSSPGNARSKSRVKSSSGHRVPFGNSHRGRCVSGWRASVAARRAASVLPPTIAPISA